MGSEQNMEYTKSGMLMRFLKGSKRFFAGSILASILVAAMDMIAPQIIRIVVDGCLGEDLSQLPSLAQRTLAAVGGADYLREHLYLAAVGILLAAGCAEGETYVLRSACMWSKNSGAAQIKRVYAGGSG